MLQAAFSVRYFVIHPGPENIDLKPSSDRFDRLEFAAERLDRLQSIVAGLALDVHRNKLPHLLFAAYVIYSGFWHR